MPRTCTVCTHLQRAAVDTALGRGEDAFRTIADRFGLSATALKRHKAGVLTDEEIPDRVDREARRHWWPHLEPSGA
jgi:hypothetical protein